MMIYLIRQLFDGERWHNDVYVTVEAGMIVGVDTFLPDSDEVPEVIDGMVFPGMPNLHSHVFQYAIAGLSEFTAQEGQNSFWSWRHLMYRFVAGIEPEHLYVIARKAFKEMLLAGYTSVAEFQYLHHDHAGKHYADKAIMSKQIIQAAIDTGIAITHLPVLYQFGDFGTKPLSTEQMRFYNSFDDYVALFSDLQSYSSEHLTVQLGLSPHSLRAVDQEGINFLEALSRQSGCLPIHIHIAEQTQEVDACIAYTGRRPVQWLYDHFPVNERWCLVHATHVNPTELQLLAQSEAVLGLCITTEANLGDGIFPMRDFVRLNGHWGIGSDSHISIDPVEELRWLEYEQRLLHKQRTVLGSQNTRHCGQWLYGQALSGGAKALGQNIGFIKPGYRADWLVIRESEWAPQPYGLDRFIFSRRCKGIEKVMVAGRWVVNEGKHLSEEDINQGYGQFYSQWVKTL